MIPNDIEPLYGFDPENADTDLNRINDFDELSYDAEKNWTNGSADNEDWSYPGKQWK